MSLAVAASLLLGCATKASWKRPLFSGSNCGMPAPLAPTVFNASAVDVSAALGAALARRDWRVVSSSGDNGEALYKRPVATGSGQPWLPATHAEYLLVIVTPIDALRSKVVFMKSEYEPRGDEATSFAVSIPEKLIDDFANIVQEVKGASAGKRGNGSQAQ